MESQRSDVPGFQPGLDTFLDVGSLKGLAHPIRLRLRAELASHGPATATQLAARIGESSASTSYHLRKLAAHGFIVEDEALGNGRDRYWRSVHRSVFSEPEDLAGQEFGGEFMRAVAQVAAERILRFRDVVLEDTAEILGEEWARAWNMSDWGLDLTPDEARQLAQAFHALCAPHRHEAGKQRTGTRLVRVQFQVLPPPPDETQS